MFDNPLPRPEVQEPRDYVGKVIHEGDIIAYPVRKGSDMILKSSIVAEISGVVCPDAEPAYPIIMLLSESGRRVPFLQIGRCIVIGNIYNEEEQDDAELCV
jgi:hypothetical protein